MKEKRQVRVLLRGGLGNQLFQYFTALEIAKRMNRVLVLDTSLLPESPFVNRQGVSVFTDAMSFSHLGKKQRGALYKWLPDRTAHFLYTRKTQLNQKLARQLSAFGLWTHFIGDDGVVKLESVLDRTRDLTVASLCLVSEPKLEIDLENLSALSQPINPTSWFIEEKKLTESVRPVAIHIRLGDHWRLGERVSRDYLARAVAFVRQGSNNDHIWIYSDEPERATALVESIHGDLRIIEPPGESKPIESLALMSMASVLVTSKSTFSFWAARLGSAQGLRVILNREWFEQGDCPIYLNDCDESWIRI